MYLFFHSFLLMSPQGEGGGNLISTLILFGLIAGIVYLFFKKIKKKSQPKFKRVIRKTKKKNPD